MKNLSFEHKNNRFELKLLTHGAQCCTGCRKILRKSRKTVKLLLDPPDADRRERKTGQLKLRHVLVLRVESPTVKVTLHHHMDRSAQMISTKS